MSRLVLRVKWFVPVLALALATSVVVARPPDLPVNTEDHCTPTSQPVSRPASSAGCSGEAQVRVPPPMAAEVEGEMIREVERALRKMIQVRRLFQMAERYQKEGELELAQACYEEVVLLLPTSRYGQVASQRIEQIEKTQRAPGKTSEESEEATEEDEQPLSPQAQERRNRMRAALDLYTVGERCWQKGDLEMAQNCFTEVSRLCPNSDLAQGAQRKLTILHALREVGDSDANEPITGSEMPQDTSRLQLPPPTWDWETIRALEQQYSRVEVIREDNDGKGCRNIVAVSSTRPGQTLAFARLSRQRACQAGVEEQTTQPPFPGLKRWQCGMQRLMGVLGPVELDFDMTQPGAIRYQGKVFCGLLGLIIRGQYTADTSTFGVEVEVLP